MMINQEHAALCFIFVSSACLHKLYGWRKNTKSNQNIYE